MVAAVVFAALLVGTPSPPSSETSTTDLDEGIALYWSGEYQRTIDVLSTICAESRRLDESVECLKYLAFSHVAVGDDQLAQSAFRKLLTSDPNHVLEKDLVSPKIVRQFETARASLVEELFDLGKAAYFAESFEDAQAKFRAVLSLDGQHPLASEYLSLLDERIALVATAKQDEPVTSPVAGSATPPPAEPVEEPIYHVTGQIVAPVLLSRVSPTYPISARRSGVEGTVVATLVVGVDGTVTDARIIRGVSPDIDRETLDAVRQWTYQPALMDERPVSVYSVVQLSFSLSR